MLDIARKLRFPFVVTLALVGGCSQPSATTKMDISDVLTLAAQEAERKLPKSYCVRSALEPSGVIWPKQAEAGGWVDAPNEKNLKYRKVVGPDTQSLPKSALDVFGESRVERNCRHPLSFHKPVFTQYRTPSGTYLEAMVSISDTCPVCGRGYVVFFRRDEKFWVKQDPGLESTWSS
jgi:hypothetical protein